MLSRCHPAIASGTAAKFENQNDTFPEMVKRPVRQLVAIYLILMFQFRSVVDPLVIMAAIPLGFLARLLGF